MSIYRLSCAVQAGKVIIVLRSISETRSVNGRDSDGAGGAMFAVVSRNLTGPAAVARQGYAVSDSGIISDRQPAELHGQGS